MMPRRFYERDLRPDLRKGVSHLDLPIFVSADIDLSSLKILLSDDIEGVEFGCELRKEKDRVLAHCRFVDRFGIIKDGLVGYLSIVSTKGVVYDRMMITLRQKVGIEVLPARLIFTMDARTDGLYKARAIVKSPMHRKGIELQINCKLPDGSSPKVEVVPISKDSARVMVWLDRESVESAFGKEVKLYWSAGSVLGAAETSTLVEFAN